MNQRQLFLQHLAQTSPAPLCLEVEKAEGIYLYDASGKRYIDLIAGIAVSNVGHRHPDVVAAIKHQLDRYMHVMVYGEYIQTPQVRLSELLAQHLPENLNCTYLLNSGTEAMEGALKLAKRLTGRTEIIACKNAYHGSTHGSLSLMGNEYFKNAFRPLLPGVTFMEFNKEQDLELISAKTACVVIEPVQGEAGAVTGNENYFKKLRKRCDDTGALLVFDEVQTAFGRMGSLFAFEQLGVIPDVLVLAKGMGGGMPIGAFIASKERMSALSHHPELGHITTFGGHPVCAAAAMAALDVVKKDRLAEEVPIKEKLFREYLRHKTIKEIRGKGLLLAVDFGSEEFNKKVIARCIQNGVITDWFLFNQQSMRIAPPLTITKDEIKTACDLVLKSIEEAF